jgi:fructokinase
MPESHPPSIACFGEVLWDCLPRGIFLGGAPMNVAYHLRRLGVPSRMISAVGRDFLGAETRRRLTAWEVDHALVGESPRPTGVVHARLDGSGVAHYTIERDSAWDAITVTEATLRRTPPPTAVIFGTLALRRPANRRALARLLAAWPQAVRVVDLNLRPPFDRPGAIDWALARATLLKVNTDELNRLVGAGRNLPPDWARAARRLARRSGIDHICVTAGARGAGLLWDDAWIWRGARPIKVRDTVGAGDAFLAALLDGLLVRGEPPRVALARACRLGEFVASQDGATPAYRCDARGRPVPMSL